MKLMEADLKITSLFRPQGPRTATELAKALSQAEAAYRQTENKLEELTKDRVEALLNSSDPEVDAIEAEQARVSREQDRLLAAITEMGHRLAAADMAEKADARAKLWTSFLKRHEEAAQQFETAAADCLQRFAELNRVTEEALGSGFANEVAAQFVRPPALAVDGVAVSDVLIARFGSEHRRLMEARKPKPATPKPAPAPAAQPAAAKPNAKPNAKPQKDFANTAPPPPKPPRPLHQHVGPVPEGFMRVAFRLAGVPISEALGLSRIGDEVALDRERALILAKNGAVIPDFGEAAPSNEKENA